MIHKDGLASRVIKSVILPLSLFLAFAGISLVTGNAFLSVRMMLYSMKLTGVTLLVALAISIQIMNGSFDFSLGAIMYLAAIVGTRFAMDHDAGPLTMAALIVIIAIALSLLNSFLYILLRIPPVVISLMTVMLYEALTQIFEDGKGVMIVTRPQYAVFYQEPTVFIIAGVMMLLFWAVMKYTRFGLEARALSQGQKVAVDFGIKEKTTVIKRYFIVGVFLGVAAVLYLGQVLSIDAARNMSSTVVMFQAIMPGMIGRVLAKYSNIPVGTLMAALSMQFISVGFTCMGLDSNLASAINGIFILIFIAYTGNLPLMVKALRRKKTRKELAGVFTPANNPMR
jgi:ribose/xylose/arabinose/galactoside ABC-type transport system permease subunit